MTEFDPRGVFVPHVTPLTEDGDVDTDSLASLVDRLAGVDGLGGLVSCARVGEGPVLTWAEHLAVFDLVADRVPADLPHVATVGAQSTREAIEKVRDAADRGADAAMLVPPLLFAWGDAEPEMRYQFFADVAAATDLPLVLFQVPVASYWYDADTVARISHLDGVAAVKEASFNVELFTDVVRTVRNEGGDINVLSGNDRFLAQSMMLGIDGALVGVANLAPERWVEMYDLAADDRYAEALALQEDLLAVKERTFAEPIVEAPARIKYCLAEQGLIETARVRRPQRGIDERARRELGPVLDALGSADP